MSIVPLTVLGHLPRAAGSRENEALRGGRRRDGEWLTRRRLAPDHGRSVVGPAIIAMAGAHPGVRPHTREQWSWPTLSHGRLRIPPASLQGRRNRSQAAAVRAGRTTVLGGRLARDGPCRLHGSDPGHWRRACDTAARVTFPSPRDPSMDQGAERLAYIDEHRGRFVRRSSVDASSDKAEPRKDPESTADPSNWSGHSTDISRSRSVRRCSRSRTRGCSRW